MTQADGIITGVERHPKSARRYMIFIDGAFAFAVHEDVLIKHRLLKGELVDRGRLEQALEEEEQHKAWSDALKLIGRRPRSEKELRQYLKRKQVAQPLVDRVVHKLKEQNYIDDADFAAQWTEHRMLTQKKGRSWVKQELQQKGIAPAVIQETLGQVKLEQEEEAAFQTGSKKWAITSGTKQDKKRKTAAFLMRRGYSGAIAGKVVRRIAESSPDDPDHDEETDFEDWFDT